MTKKEMSEIFAAMLLAYPNAEVFKGGIAKLDPTINLWATCLPEVDFWTGQQAIIKLVRKCKFPPTIAEFKDQAEEVKSEIKSNIDNAWLMLRNDLDRKSPGEVFAALPSGSQVKAVISAMGGPDKLLVRSEHVYGDGRRESYLHYNYSGFCNTYEQLLKRTGTLGETTTRAISAGKRQIGGNVQ